MIERMLGELNHQQIVQVLHSEVVGRIGCHSDGRTYVVPVTYAFEDLAVYAHSAVGTKVRMMRQNPSVCFEVDHLDDLSHWRSVIAWGRFEELTGDEAERGMEILMGRLAPLMVSETAGRAGQRAGHGGARPAGEAVVFRIDFDEMSGRFERD